MRRDGRTHFATHALYYVEHTRGEARLDATFGQKMGGVRSDLRRLRHHRATGCQRRGYLPCEEVEREVPRADAPNHTHRLPVGIIHCHIIGDMGFT